LRRTLARARQPLEIIEQVAEEAAELAAYVEKPVKRRATTPPVQPGERPIRLGAKVRLRTLNTQGVVTALTEKEAEVQVGVLRIRTRLADLEVASAPAEEGTTPPPRPQKSTTETAASKNEPGAAFAPQSPGIELDLRGKRADEALDALDRYLDAAYLAGLPFVRLIHGKGTGKLRARQFFRSRGGKRRR